MDTKTERAGEPGSWWQRHGHRVGALVALGMLLAAVLGMMQVWRNAQPLVPANVPAVILEAQERLKAKTPMATPWRTLDARQLATLLQGGELLTAPESVRFYLVDQAAAWNLLHFDRPSQVLAQWQRVGVDNGLGVPVRDRPAVRTIPNWVATTEWSDEAGAALALWDCLPDAVWGESDQPMALYLGQERNWFAPAGSPQDFAHCVRQQRERAPYGTVRSALRQMQDPETARGRRSAAVLLKKLPAQIESSDCKATGVDDCLAALWALISLGADRATLLPLLARIAPGYAPDAHFARLLADPPPTATDVAASAGPPGGSTQDVQRLPLMALFLDVRIAALMAPAPADAPLPAGEPAATLRRLLDVGQALHRVQHLGAPSIFVWRGVTDAPWVRVERAAQAQPAWQAALDEVGTSLAALPGCQPLVYEPSSEAKMAPPDELWLAYALRKLETTGTGCGLVPPKELLRHLERGAGDPVVARVARLVGREDHALAHAEIVGALQGLCPLKTDVLALCAWLRDADAPAARDGFDKLPLKPGEAWAELPLDKLPHTMSAAIDRLAAQQPAWGAAAVSVSAHWPANAGFDVRQQWLSPDAKAAALWLRRIDDAPEGPRNLALRSRNVLLLVDGRGARTVNLSSELEESALTLSDLDGDGNLEVWAQQDQGECDGEGLRPGIDCAIPHAWLVGEVFGSEVVPYLKGPWPAAPTLAAAGARASSAGP